MLTPDAGPTEGAFMLPVRAGVEPALSAGQVRDPTLLIGQHLPMASGEGNTTR